MRADTLSALFLTLASSVSAFPSLAARAPAVGEWAAPGPDDIRGPCPGLNTLANHGYLPRNGRNIRAIDIITAMDTFLGIRADFGSLQTIAAGFRGAFVFLPDLSVGLASFDTLTNSHNLIEHDASFTRNDMYFDLLAQGLEHVDKDALPVMHNPPVNETLVDWLLAHSKDGVLLTVDDIAEARHGRLLDSVARNPTADISKHQTDAMWRANTFMSLVLGDADGAIRVDWLREWFVNQRLPTAMGWKRRSHGGGIIDNLTFIRRYIAAEKLLNGNDVEGRTPELPLEFGLLF